MTRPSVCRWRRAPRPIAIASRKKTLNTSSWYRSLLGCCSQISGSDATAKRCRVVLLAERAKFEEVAAQKRLEVESRGGEMRHCACLTTEKPVVAIHDEQERCVLLGLKDLASHSGSWIRYRRAGDTLAPPEARQYQWPARALRPGIPHSPAVCGSARPPTG